METGRPQVVSRYSTQANGEDVNTTNICPAALGTKDQQPAAFSPKTGLFYVPTNHVCMDYEPFKVSLHGRPALCRRHARMYPAPGGTHLGNFIAWDAERGQDRLVDPRAVLGLVGRSGHRRRRRLLRHARGLPEGGRRRDGRELYRFKTPSGIIGNVNTWMHKGQQYVGVLSGIGGWAGIGLAAGLQGDQEGLGAVGAYKSLSSYTQLGGQLTVFKLGN